MVLDFISVQLRANAKFITHYVKCKKKRKRARNNSDLIRKLFPKFDWFLYIFVHKFSIWKNIFPCLLLVVPLYNATLFKRFRHVFLINCSLTLGPVWILHSTSWQWDFLPAVNCPLPKPLRDGRIVHDKPVTGATTMYGQGWTYECNPPKAPSYERGSCMADGSASEPPVCRGTQMPVKCIFSNRLSLFHVFLSSVILPGLQTLQVNRIQFNTNKHHIYDWCGPEYQIKSAKPFKNVFSHFSALQNTFSRVWPGFFFQSPQRWAAPFRWVSQTASSPLLWWEYMATRRRLNTAAMRTTSWTARQRYSARTRDTGLPSRSAEASHGETRS